MPIVRRTPTIGSAGLVVTAPERWPNSPVRYATAISAVGDTFVACGLAQEVMRRTGQDSIGMIYYGRHQQIVDFLEHQPWINEVIFRPQQSHDELMSVASYRGSQGNWTGLDGLLGEISSDDVWPTHITNRCDEMPCYPFCGSLLPRKSWEWSAKFRGQLPPDTYLLHPWSFQSAALEHHWPHWQELVSWLLDHTPHTYILTGVGYNGGEFGHHPRLVNQVGKIHHLNHALALACECRGVITTCNSFGLWTAVRQLRGFILGNRAIVQPKNVFFRFMDQPSAEWHWDWETLGQVQDCLGRWLL